MLVRRLRRRRQPEGGLPVDALATCRIGDHIDCRDDRRVRGPCIDSLPVEPAGRGPNRRKLRSKDGVRCEAAVLHKSRIGNRLWGWCDGRGTFHMQFPLGFRRTSRDDSGRDAWILGVKAEPLIQQTTDNRVEPVPQFREPLRRCRSREQDSARCVRPSPNGEVHTRSRATRATGHAPLLAMKARPDEARASRAVKRARRVPRALVSPSHCLLASRPQRLRRRPPSDI